MTNNKDYLINDTFIFETSKSIVFLKDESDKFVELSKPASRLLSEIITLNQRAKIATREELLTNVWEEYGLVGSNNNLNTYVSEIRKKFELIGLDPKSIITVPKKGFRFDCESLEIITNENNSDLLQEEMVVHNDNNIILSKNNYILSDPSPQQNIEHSREELLTNPIDSQPPVTEYPPRNTQHHEPLELTLTEQKDTKKTRKQSKLKSSYMVVAFIALFSVSLTFAFHFITSSNASMKENDYITVSERDKCLIQVPVHLVESSTKDSIDYVNKKLDKYNVNCQEPKRVILLSELNTIQPVDKNISISICKEKNTQYDCVSINDQRI
ncbi:winged helix-turn-helix domain-containing protein [Providencia stuartii]|uniref:winged helix-turn-helix domain-containing protein n=1 Tax=unclassified Providencia TaxID=2633465 RepID=UPI00234B2FC3|nr:MULTISPECIES: winged helix-turn-helix domain-containing protein [unclassified Providencia]ELR5122944.1 winged helix-turn-helix domain-containing protein [Providencia stuartii]